MFLGGLPPCDPCGNLDAPPGDPEDPVWMQWLADNLNAAIYETGPSAFIYTNGFGLTVTDSMTSNDPNDDTTITIVRRLHFNDSAFIIQVVPFSTENSDIESEPGDEAAAKTTDGRSNPRSWVNFPPSYCSYNGSSVSCTPLEVSGDQVTFGLEVVDFGDPWPVGPPTLSDMVRDVLHNPPPMLTAMQISQACSEGAISIANCRIVSVLKSITRQTTNAQGTWRFVGTYSFAFEHCWEFVCPNGPQRRKLFMSYEYEETTTLDGVEIGRTSITVLYSHTYP